MRGVQDTESGEEKRRWRAVGVFRFISWDGRRRASEIDITFDF